MLLHSKYRHGQWPLTQTTPVEQIQSLGPHFQNQENFLLDFTNYATQSFSSSIPNGPNIHDSENLPYDCSIKESASSKKIIENQDPLYTALFSQENFEKESEDLSRNLETLDHMHWNNKKVEDLSTRSFKSIYDPSEPQSPKLSDRYTKILSMQHKNSEIYFLNPVFLLARRRMSQNSSQLSQEFLDLTLNDMIIENEESDAYICSKKTLEFGPVKWPVQRNCFSKSGSVDEISSSTYSPDSMVTDDSLDSFWSDCNSTPVLNDNRDVLSDLSPTATCQKYNSVDLSHPEFNQSESKVSDFSIGLITNDAGIKNRANRASSCENDPTYKDDTLVSPMTDSDLPIFFHENQDGTATLESIGNYTIQQHFLDLENIQNILSRFKFDVKVKIRQESTTEERNFRLSINEKENCQNMAYLQGHQFRIKYSTDSSEDKIWLKKSISEINSWKDNFSFCENFFSKKSEHSDQDWRGDSKIKLSEYDDASDFRYGRQDTFYNRALIMSQQIENNNDTNTVSDIDITTIEKIDSQKLSTLPPKNYSSMPQTMEVKPPSNSPGNDFHLDNIMTDFPRKSIFFPTFNENIFSDKKIFRRHSSITNFLSSLDSVSPNNTRSFSSLWSSMLENHYEASPTQIFDSSLSVRSNKFLLSKSLTNMNFDSENEQEKHDLTESSLAAYQHDLASSTCVAAANSWFCQNNFVSDEFSVLEEEISQPSLSDSSRYTISPESISYFDEYMEDVDLEDDLENYAIIEAANAEALASDYDGFYGKEFGFYSAPDSLTDDFVYENGGYFGSVGLERLRSSRSSHFCLREPILTPITECSECSYRNSNIPTSIQSPNSIREMNSLL